AAARIAPGSPSRLVTARVDREALLRPLPVAPSRVLPRGSPVGLRYPRIPPVANRAGVGDHVCHGRGLLPLDRGAGPSPEIAIRGARRSHARRALRGRRAGPLATRPSNSRLLASKTVPLRYLAVTNQEVVHPGQLGESDGC